MNSIEGGYFTLKKEKLKEYLNFVTKFHNKILKTLLLMLKTSLNISLYFVVVNHCVLFYIQTKYNDWVYPLTDKKRKKAVRYYHVSFFPINKFNYCINFHVQIRLCWNFKWMKFAASDEITLYSVHYIK